MYNNYIHREYNILDKSTFLLLKDLITTIPWFDPIKIMDSYPYHMTKWDPQPIVGESWARVHSNPLNYNILLIVVSWNQHVLTKCFVQEASFIKPHSFSKYCTIFFYCQLPTIFYFLLISRQMIFLIVFCHNVKF